RHLEEGVSPGQEVTSRGWRLATSRSLLPASPVDHPVATERTQELRDEPLAVVLGHPLIVGNTVKRVGVELVTEIHFEWAGKYGRGLT
ncbi:MAG TPA: hypothetical protein VNR88_09360, partial [Hyphomicrobium sp.]|nr:hypothetical protein [Hyphomicrobium sp.]